jgi:hypothetical protein
MAAAVYMLCALTSIVCAALLIKSGVSAGKGLLFWSGWGFACFALGNVMLFIDLVVFQEYDLLLVRNVLTLSGILMMLYGLIFNSE